MNLVFTLCLPRDEASVPIVRHVCRDALVDLGVEGDCVADVELAVTEACTNVLKHVARHDGDYEVSVEIAEHTCQIRVIDSTGKAFDHQSRGDPLLLAEGGRGIVVMRALMDELDFASQPDTGAVVHLVKRLSLQEGSILRDSGAHRPPILEP